MNCILIGRERNTDNWYSLDLEEFLLECRPNDLRMLYQEEKISELKLLIDGQEVHSWIFEEE